MLALTLAALPLFVLTPSQDPRIVDRDAELIVRPDCADSLVDQADPQSCLQASSTPTLGMLYPLSTSLFVDTLGRVGVGTTTPGYPLHVTSDDPIASLHVQNGSGNGIQSTSTYSNGAAGILGRFDNGSAAGGYGVRGEHTGSSFFGAGVYGRHSGNGIGVVGEAFGPSGLGVYGAANFAGVHGASNNGYGTVGTSYSDQSNAAGVFGHLNDFAPGSFSAGVRGENEGTGTSGVGVYGRQQGNGYGVYGRAEGSLGTGVVGSGSNYGLFSFGDLGVLGAKAFVQPHPTDSAQEIRFVCLEGNESGTYFRGSSRLVNGAATIDVPEDFRLVTELEGLTVQVTALGDARVWVEHKDLGRIEVRGRPDVEFDYFVNGVRRGFADFETLRPNTSMVPRFRDEPYAENLPTAVRDLMVQNGMLNADYTPNEATAVRNGWELSDPAPSAREATPPHDVDRR